MARKRPISNLSPASSSEDEQGLDNQQHEAGEQSSQGNTSDEEPQNGDVVEDEAKTPLKTKKIDSGNVGSESDSAKSLPSPNISYFTIKPIVTKPNKSTSKSTPKPKPTATKSSSKQRKPSSSASKGGGNGSVKTPGTARLWSEADEIAILKGMIEYKSKKEADPYADSSRFDDFISQSIQADMMTYQLSQKIKRLKKKYKTNAAKGHNGKDPVFTKPHDHNSFELYKKLWGDETNEISNKRQKKIKTLSSEDEGKTEINGALTVGLPSSVKDKEVNTDVSTQVSSDSDEEEDFWKDYPCLKESFEMGRWGPLGGRMVELEKSYATIGRQKLMEMESEWRKLKIMELELHLKKHDLIQEIAHKVLDGFRRSDV